MLRTSPVQTSEPVWDLAELFPHQGAWSEEDYLELETNRLIEFSHGQLEVLPMPTESHQNIVLFLYELLKSFLQRTNLGKVLVAPLRVRLWPGKYREPDVMVMLAEHANRRHEQYWETPDLVLEVVSPDNRHLDVDTKRREYARAGISEYWIVDPQATTITVLTLQGEQYAVAGSYGRDRQAASVLLAGFEVEVNAAWAAAESH
ncbi:MAG: Uma2 family endonuclease [Chloroflexi bacterium]|nr:Uma2 family endonuclease [Chloroflexota bacterium]